MLMWLLLLPFWFLLLMRMCCGCCCCFDSTMQKLMELVFPDVNGKYSSRAWIMWKEHDPQAEIQLNQYWFYKLSVSVTLVHAVFFMFYSHSHRCWVRVSSTSTPWTFWHFQFILGFLYVCICVCVPACPPVCLSVCLSACLSVTVFTKLIDFPVHGHGKLIFCRLRVCALDERRETTRLKLFCCAQVVISHGLCSILIKIIS